MSYQPNDTLTPYDSFPITLFRRKDCDPRGTSGFLRQVLRNIPNNHPKMPDRKQRTPNVTVDNLCLFKNRQGQICTVLGLFDKTVPINGTPVLFKGWTMSGGHMEYHQDLSTEECARRELLEEFGIQPSNIVRSLPIAIFEDLLRDGRNEYISTVYLHWINQVPKATDEHKSVITVTLDELVNVLRGGKKIKVPSNLPYWRQKQFVEEEYGLINGHDSMIVAIMDLPAYKQFIGDIAVSH